MLAMEEATDGQDKPKFDQVSLAFHDQWLHVADNAMLSTMYMVVVIDWRLPFKSLEGLSILGGWQFHCHAVKCLGQLYLATQSAVFMARYRRKVEHGLLIVAGWRQLFQPLFFH